MIYYKLKDYITLNLYGRNDLFKDNLGVSTKLNKSQVSSVLTPYITNKFNDYINCKTYRFNIGDKFQFKQFSQNLKIFFNIFTLPILKDIQTPHQIILRLLNTNDNNEYYDDISEENSVIICNYSYDLNSSSTIVPHNPSDTTTVQNTTTNDPITNITTNTTVTTQTIITDLQTTIITTTTISSSDFTDYLSILEAGLEFPFKVVGINNDWYYIFDNDLSIYQIYVLQDLTCDVFLIGGGGRGGTGNYAGGGGAGEVVLKYNHTFTPGTYNINVGSVLEPSTIKNSDDTITIFNAQQGGNGGSFYTLNTNSTVEIPANSYYRVNGGGFASLPAGTYTISFNPADINAGAIRLTSGGTNIIDRSAPFVYSPLVWYKFDLSTALNYDSMQIASLTNVGTPPPVIDTTDFCRGVGCVNFSGTNSFSYNTGSSFSPDTFTISCFIKSPTNATTTNIITNCRDTTVGAYKGWALYILNNDLYFWTGNGANTTITNIFTGFSSATPIWRHVAVSVNKTTNTTKVYINGSLTQTITSTYTNLTTGGFYMGLNCVANTKLDDYRFYNRILTDNEISYIYTGNVDIYSLPSLNGGGFSGYIDNPLVWYKFNNSLADSGSANTTLSVSQYYTAGSYDTTDYKRGNACISLNGSQGYNTTLNFRLFENSCTVCFWMKITGYNTNYDNIFYHPNMFIQRHSNTNNFTITLFGSTALIINNFFVADNTWKHVCITAEKVGTATRINFYVNNVFQSQNNINGTGTWNNSGAGVLYMSSFSSATPFFGMKGKLDDVRIYNRVISTVDLNNIYNESQLKGGTAIPTTTNPAGTYNYFGNGGDGNDIKGGNGGENVGHTYNIYGDVLDVAYGGVGGNLASTPALKPLYGSGGDAKNGAGKQGLVILRFKNILTTTTTTGNISIYHERTINKIDNYSIDLLNSFSIPSTFLNRGYIDLQLLTFSDADITFTENQTNRLMLNATIFEPDLEITKDISLAPDINHKALKNEIK